MSVITFDDNNINNESNIICFKNEDKYNITLNIVDKLNLINENKKTLYFNYSYSEKELLEKFELLNNKNIIIIDKKSNTIDDIEKYIVYSKPICICVDYFKMIDNKCCYKIENNNLKYVLDKIEEYNKKYGVIFIVAINLESK